MTSVLDKIWFYISPCIKSTALCAEQEWCAPSAYFHRYTGNGATPYCGFDSICIFKTFVIVVFVAFQTFLKMKGAFFA
jgi:hypothetical protein